jgi:hypothetical protein
MVLPEIDCLAAERIILAFTGVDLRASPPQSSWTRSRLPREVADYGGIVELDRCLI